MAADVTPAGAIAVFHNQQDGSFGPPGFLDMGSGQKPASFVAAGDLDGDGRADLVATSEASGIIGVLLNAGNGQFLPVRTIAASNPDEILLADLNADGALDLVVGDWGGNSTFTPYFNDGHGSFHAGSVYGPDGDYGTFQDLAAGNFRGRAVDIVACGQQARHFVFYANDGLGHFTASAGSIPGGYGLAAADFDRNGTLDLAVGDGAPRVSLLLNPGNAEFGVPASTFAVGEAAAGFGVADFDGDGYPDLAVAGGRSGTLSVLLSRCVVDEGRPDAR